MVSFTLNDGQRNFRQDEAWNGRGWVVIGRLTTDLEADGRLTCKHQPDCAQDERQPAEHAQAQRLVQEDYPP